MMTIITCRGEGRGIVSVVCACSTAPRVSSECDAMKLPPDEDDSPGEETTQNGLPNGTDHNLLPANGTVPMPHTNGLTNGHIDQLEASAFTDSINDHSAIAMEHSDVPAQSLPVSGVENADVFDLVIASPAQTLEQLVSSFTHLSAADLIVHHHQSFGSTGLSQNLVDVLLESIDSLPYGHGDPVVDERQNAASGIGDVLSSVPMNASNSGQDEDMLEELVLTDVYNLEPRPESLGYQLKVDNFVEPDGSDVIADEHSAADEAAFNALGFVVPSYNVAEASFHSQAPTVEADHEGLVSGSAPDLDGDDNFNGHEELPLPSSDDEAPPLPPVFSTASQNQAAESTTENVETFSLDPNFDYDNVALSEKFTPEMLNELRSIATEPRS